MRFPYVGRCGRYGHHPEPHNHGQAPKSGYVPETAGAVDDGTVSVEETTEITEFLTTFFTLYPTATEQESFIMSWQCAAGDWERHSYVFAGLVNPVLYQNGGDAADGANVAVQYLTGRDGYDVGVVLTLHLRQVEGIRKISC